MVYRFGSSRDRKMGLKLVALTVFLVLAAWKLSSDGRDHTPPIMTFDGSCALNSNVLRAPDTREEIVQLVRESYNRRQKLRVLGSGHSLYPLAVSQGVTLTLHNYRGLIDIDIGAKQATVKAGTTLDELNALLDEHGLALNTFSTIGLQTVAGAIATATHGTGMEYGNLASMVVGLEIVTGRGEVLTVHKGDEYFDAMVTSIGLLGVVTKVTIQCADAFNLKQVTRVLSLQECARQWGNLSRTHRHCSYWLDLYSNSCLVITADKTSDPPGINYNPIVANIKFRLFELIQWIMSTFPSLSTRIMPSFLGSRLIFFPQTRVGKSYEIFKLPFYVGPQSQQEIVVDRRHCIEALETLHGFVLDRAIPLNSFVELRPVKGDSLWMSPNYQRDSCHFTQLLYYPTSWDIKEQYFFGSFEALAEYAPRPHWGKIFNLTATKIRNVYPRFDDFLQVRKQLDPADIFLNRFLKDIMF